MWWPRSHCGTTTAHHSPPAETRTRQRYCGQQFGFVALYARNKIEKKKTFLSFHNDMLVLHDMQMKITRAMYRAENTFQMEVVFLK